MQIPLYGHLNGETFTEHCEIIFRKCAFNERNWKRDINQCAKKTFHQMDLMARRNLFVVVVVVVVKLMEIYKWKKN